MKKIIATLSIVLGISLIGAMTGTVAGSGTAYGQTVADGRGYMEGFIFGVNEGLPQDLMIFTLRSAEIKDNTVRFFMDVSIPDVLNDLYDALTESKIKWLAVLCGGQVQSCKMLAASELDVEYVLADTNTKETKTVVVKAAEIKESIDNLLEDIKNVQQSELESLPLEDLVAGIKEDLPSDLGDGMTLVDVRIEKDILVCYTDVDDDEVVKEMNDIMNEGEALIKLMLMQTFIRDDGMKVLIKALKSNNMGIAYVLKSTKSDEKCEIVFTPEDLKEVGVNK